MATICKKCASQIVFDPKTQKVVCHSCGSSWKEAVDDSFMDMDEKDS